MRKKLFLFLSVLFLSTLIFGQVDTTVDRSSFTSIVVDIDTEPYTLSDCSTGLIENPTFLTPVIWSNPTRNWYSTAGTPTLNGNSITMVAWQNKAEAIVQVLPELSDGQNYVLEMAYKVGLAGTTQSTSPSIDIYLGNNSLVDNSGFSEVGVQHSIPALNGFQQISSLSTVNNNQSNSGTVASDQLYMTVDSQSRLLRLSFTYNGALNNDRIMIFPNSNSSNGVAINISSINIFCDEVCEFNKTTLMDSESYWLSAWVNVDTAQVKSYVIKADSAKNAHLEIDFVGQTAVSPLKLYPTGNIIDGWQRIVGKIEIPANTTDLKLSLNADLYNDTYFDDIRIHPFNASMKSYVYDGSTFWLTSELDDNNYATFYEYDNEGGLIRIKKETERGIVTIQETRSSSAK